VVVEAVNAPDARLEEVTGHARADAYYALHSRTMTITKERCTTLPCALDLAHGDTELEVVTDATRQTFRVPVADARTYLRVRVSEHERPALGILGLTLIGLSIGSTAASSVLMGESPSFLLPGGVMFGVSCAITMVGVILALTHPFTDRPSSYASWTESLGR
jgi:hypothetical protein